MSIELSFQKQSVERSKVCRRIHELQQKLRRLELIRTHLNDDQIEYGFSLQEASNV
jgi:hypothetical protein